MTQARIGRRGVFAGAGSILAAPRIVRAQGQASGVALVIGNSKYQWEAQLPNVRRDAPDAARRFQALGLRTEVLMDADRQAMLAALEKLKAAAQGAPLAAVYFAGHGVTWEKFDYLVPVDADLGNPASIMNLVRTRQFYDAIAAAGHKLLVFDNCRNNPADGWRQTEAERRATVVTPGGDLGPASLLLTSTAPGQVALDGPPGQNSPFAASLFRQLDMPAVDLQSLPGKIRRDLLVATEGRQMMFSRTMLTAPFTLGRAGAGPAVPALAIDPARIVELPKAYAVAAENRIPMPEGLIAIRPSNGQNGFRVGSYRAMTRNKYGKYPRVVVILSVEKGDRADIISAGTSYNGLLNWKYLSGVFEGNRLKLISATGGPDSADIYIEWKNPTSATWNMHQPLSTNGGMFSTDFVRLDG
jgi:hypothetical protein